jgi:hypothetical protein
MMTTPPSGVDLARIALQAARAAARANGTQGAKKPRRGMAVVERRGHARDPQTLDAAINGLIATRGWELEKQAGSITDRWRTLAPTEIAATTVPEHYDAEQRILHVRPTTPAAATWLRLSNGDLAAHLNRHLGQDLIAGIKVLPPGRARRQAVDPAPASGGFVEDDPDRQKPLQQSPEMLAWRKRHATRQAERDAAPPRAVHPLFESAYGILREPEPEPVRPSAAAEDAAARIARAAEVQAKALAVARKQPRVGESPMPRTLGAA